MRFIHTSDWHLGKLFFGEYLTHDQAYVLDQFIHLVSDVKPDAVVIAGDIYDRAVPPADAVQLLDEVLSRLLLDCKTPVIAIAGNHDSPERIGFGNRLLARQGLHVVGPLTGDCRPVMLSDKHGPVYFVPLTYAEPAAVRLTLQADSANDHHSAMDFYIRHALNNVPSRARTVAVAHAFISGGEASESERPLTVSSAVGGAGTVNPALFSPFNYTALGHLHRPQSAGRDNIRYSGSLLKYSFAEANHAKGVYVVELDEQGQTKIETVCLTPRRDVRCIEGLFEDLRKGTNADGSVDDFILAILLDTEPVIDAMGRLRTIYPNIMGIEAKNRNTAGTLAGPAVDHRKLTERDLFSTFAEQSTGRPLTTDQLEALEETLGEILRQGREE